MIPVSQPFLPPQEDYNRIISKLWDSKFITNNGIYSQQLEKKLEEYLSVNSLHYVSNGTMALQLAIKSLGVKKEIITTAFSFVATTTSIIWENCKPVFIDIDPNTLCIDADKIEVAITSQTEAILATHVYGIPCDVDKIDEIAKKYNLKVIYDAAHAFGVEYNEKSLLSYGDLSAISFHATKLFHTVEGGAVINNTERRYDKSIKRLRNFGLQNEQYLEAGINAKNSEFHAAMGLCNLNHIDELIVKRRKLTETYDQLLVNTLRRPYIADNIKYNYAYYPVIFNSEEELLHIKKILNNNDIESRRYFYPSLNTMSYLRKTFCCPISEDISPRVLTLPLYSDLSINEVEMIAGIIIENLKSFCTEQAITLV